MQKEDLKKLIIQIKKYDLIKEFDNGDEFEEWLSRLNTKQIQNFNSLEINPSEILFPKRLLINYDLLNCVDYSERVKAMSKLKNGEGCYDLFQKLCLPNFLNSKSYYKDMEMISEADTAKYGLSIISEDTFINSPYHTEDLKLIVEAKDTEKAGKNKCDGIVARALVMVAKSIASISSPYHQEDMKLIAQAGSECLKNNGAIRGLNFLAINEVSLNDKYHLENMKLLAKNPNVGDFLYVIMTNPDIIKGKNYRTEVHALVNAKSKVTARAIYYYIVNPDRISKLDFSNELHDIGLDWWYISLLDRNIRMDGKLNPNYLKYLKLLNEIDDKFVLHFESLLSNEDLFNSQYREYDLNFLLSVTDIDIFMDLYLLMTDITSLSGPYHKEDVKLISETANQEIRQLLLEKAIEEYSVNSVNHRYDMQYITRLDLNSIEEKRLEVMRYYLFDYDGINCRDHIEMLEKLYRGEIPEKRDEMLEYLSNLEEMLASDDNIDFIDKESEINKNKGVKVLARIFKRFGKK